MPRPCHIATRTRGQVGSCAGSARPPRAPAPRLTGSQPKKNGGRGDGHSNRYRKDWRPGSGGFVARLVLLSGTRSSIRRLAIAQWLRLRAICRRGCGHGKGDADAALRERWERPRTSACDLPRGRSSRVPAVRRTLHRGRELRAWRSNYPASTSFEVPGGAGPGRPRVKAVRPLSPLRRYRQHLAMRLHGLRSAEAHHRGSRSSAGSQSPHGGACVTSHAKQAESRSESRTSSLERAT